MQFFAMPYRVLFHDTMAYGSHHFLTNFKFQCEAREHLYFENVVEAAEGGHELNRELVLLTQQAYSRNLGPVGVGQRVAILVTAEEPTLSSVRFCFRIIREDGAPVSCGFQTLVCTSAQTGAVVPAPPAIQRGQDLILEPSSSRSFAERALTGRLKEIFSPEVISLGIAIAKSSPETSFPRFVESGDTSQADVSTRAPEPHPPLDLGSGVLFLFPGQGAYAPWLLRRLSRELPGAGDLLAATDEICRQELGHPFTPLLAAASRSEHDALLELCPPLAQVGIFLAGALTAQAAELQGLRPDLMVGHSAGELAALAAAGAFSREEGVWLVCRRVRALEEAGIVPGGMAVTGCGEERARALLASLSSGSLDVAVVNHPEQTVVAGPKTELERLAALCSFLGLSYRPLESPYPFHSPLLKPAVSPFARSLETLRFRTLRVPVYSPIEGALYGSTDDLAERLASHFVRPFSFAAAVERLQAGGARLWVECGPGGALGRLVRRNLVGRKGVEVRSPFSETAPAEAPEIPAERPPHPAAPAPREPIAIVSLGCILPGAPNPDQLWRNLLARRIDIRDAAELRPDLAHDFLTPGGAVVPDKTYTLLGGFLREGDLPAPEPGRTRAQLFLAQALDQVLGGLSGDRPAGRRIHVYLGATADGINEYDEALLACHLEPWAADLALSGNGSGSLTGILSEAIGRRGEELPAIAPYPGYAAVLASRLGPEVKLVTVDAACASSLYAIVLGLEALASGECDLALCGGVFAPGPANSCLFSQFRGLSASGSRPLDATADGVVFGEGAALVALRRLPEARAAGDTLWALVRGAGLSSDGKSPSVAVPRRAGQVLALERAYRQAGVDPATLQYVEAHATATPVGDAEEVAALEGVFGPRPEGGLPIELGSVKASIGHTGWAAGAASVLKMSLALAAEEIPPQAAFRDPLPGLAGASSAFRVSTRPRPWPVPRSGPPRRCGVNGFGFGGSNAHLVLEGGEGAPDVASSAAAPRKPATTLAVLGVGALFGPDGTDRPPRSGESRESWRFPSAFYRLPSGVRILPDVADDLDGGQALAVRAAQEALAGLGAAWTPQRPWIGVVLGTEGKSERGLTANLRIYRDFLRRRLGEVAQRRGTDPKLVESWQAALDGRLAGLRTSGPYTLPGLMPNVTAGRVANVLDLGGPNFVISRGDASLPEALRTAAALLLRGDARLMLAGALNSFAGLEAEATWPGAAAGRPLGEAALILALAMPETARELGAPVLAELVLIPEDADVSEAEPLRAVGAAGLPCLAAAEGAIELAQALAAVRAGEGRQRIRWQGSVLELRPPQSSPKPVAAPAAVSAPARTGILGPEAPIARATPELTPCAGGPAVSPPLPEEPRLVILTDRAEIAEAIRGAGWLKTARWTLLAPAGAEVPGAVAIEVSTQERASADLAALALSEIDALVAVTELGGPAPPADLAGAAAGDRLLDLLFVCARHWYAPLESGRVRLGTLCLGALADGWLHPRTGLYAGFAKALARELPAAAVKAVATDHREIEPGWRELMDEWAQGPRLAGVESLYRAGRRHELRLRELSSLAEGRSSLSRESVVLATGGARGVTAVLMEELLRRFGCTVVLLGRTDLTRAPAEILTLSAGELDAFEPEFYRREMASGSGQRLPELRARFSSYRAAHEVAGNLERLRELPGRIDYQPVDITRAEAVEAAIHRLAAEHGRLDLVVHGAGLQSSKALVKKDVAEFRRIVATKVDGAAHLLSSCRRHFPGRPVSFHFLTSAFSFFGNDGQPDYGAANELLSRLAEGAAAVAEPGSWTALGWLGWAAVGMTRGSEYAALARARGLRAVTPPEGQALFAELLAGTPRAASAILVSAGEREFYGARLLPSEPAPPPEGRPDEQETSWPLSLARQPYLGSHRVGGVPTLPGTFEAEIAAQAACALRPGYEATAMQEIVLSRFVKVRSGQEVVLRSRARVLRESDEGAEVQVELLSDFIHASGRMLQKDALHFAARVWITPREEDLGRAREAGSRSHSVPVPDPYLLAGSPVQLGGLFRCLTDVEVAAEMQSATWSLAEPGELGSLAGFRTPAVLLDGLFRLAMIHRSEQGALPVYVPLRCGRTRLCPGVNDARLHAAGEPLFLRAPAPRVEGDLVYNSWAEATTSQGRVLLRVENLVARRTGEVVAWTGQEAGSGLGTSQGGSAHG